MRVNPFAATIDICTTNMTNRTICRLTKGLFLFLTISISTLAQAQMTVAQVRNFVKTASEAELISQNTTYLMEGYLFNADIIAERLVELKPESSNFQYRKGYTDLMVYHNYQAAIPRFEKAITSVNNNYDMFSTQEKRAPADAYYYLATCYQLNEEIEKAEANYQLFLANSKKKSDLIPATKLRLLQCAEAKKYMATPVNVRLRNVGSTINTSAPEYSPVVSLDGSALYFTTRRSWPDGISYPFHDPVQNRAPEDVYVAYRDFDAEWTEPRRLEFCSPSRNEATSAVSSDERILYLYLDSTGGGDIYYTDFYQARFTDIKMLNTKNVNTKYWETHCMVSSDKQMMYFVSDRPDGYGGRDIYYCTLLPDGTWSSPINMGPKINTPHDEDAPFISIDNRTLYFASNGAKSMGGFDIMKSERNNEGLWSEGENLGYPFNSTDDDLFYTTTVDGLTGYMTSFRKDGYGEKDIYEIQNDYLGIQNYTVLQGNLTDELGETISEEVVLVVELNCLDCDKINKRVVYPRLRDGFYLSGLEPCRTYQMDYKNLSNGSLLYTEKFKTGCESAYQTVRKDFRLNADFTQAVPYVKPLEVVEPPQQETIGRVEELVEELSVTVPPTPNFEETVQPKVFENKPFIQYLGFNKNKFIATEGELNVYLKNIEKQLAEGRQKVVIEIYASASTVPTASFKTNELLAQKRAENVKNSLVSYFGSSKFRDRIEIQIIEALVQGPAYEGDFDNEAKYGPFQYVQLKMR